MKTTNHKWSEFINDNLNYIHFLVKKYVYSYSYDMKDLKEEALQSFIEWCLTWPPSEDKYTTGIINSKFQYFLKGFWGSHRTNKNDTALKLNRFAYYARHNNFYPHLYDNELVDTAHSTMLTEAHVSSLLNHKRMTDLQVAVLSSDINSDINTNKLCKLIGTHTIKVSAAREKIKHLIKDNAI